jgi:sugar-phosphatase
MMRVVMVAGPAGAGKSTLGRALAADMGAALLDLDDLTNPILDALWPPEQGHWNDPEHRAVVRPARYAVLRAAAAAQVGSGVDLVLVAPFTAELAGGEEWAALTAAVAPAEPFVVWMDVAVDVLAARLRERGAERDDGSEGSPAKEPAVAHLRVDGTSATTDLVAKVRAGMV